MDLAADNTHASIYLFPASVNKICCLFGVVDELKESKTAADEAEQKQKDMEAEMQKMQRELEEAKSAVTILELSKQDEIESVSRQYTQELASMQSIMKGTHLVQLINMEAKVSG